MANLSLTLDCNRACRYCFAADLRATLPLDRQMSDETFTAALAMLERSAIPEVRLLGGEPTLHPHFLPFVRQALTRGKRVVVFTNGLWTDEVTAALRALPVEQLNFIVNINPPMAYGAEEKRRLHATLAALPARMTPGFNISTATPEMDFLVALIDDYGLRRTLRVGLAHPAFRGANACLRPEDYPRVGSEMVDFMARHPSVTVDFDCGFVPCMFPPGYFSEEELAARHIGHGCGLIPDVLPDGSAIPCYPLAAYWRRPDACALNSDTLRQEFARHVAAARPPGLSRACRDCAYRARDLCRGGCLAQGLRRAERVEFRTTVAAPAAEALSSPTQPRWAIPYIDQPPAFWREVAALGGERIREVYFPAPTSLVGSGRPPQPARHVETFLRDCPLPKSVLINPLVLPAPVEEIAPGVLDYLRTMRDDYGIRSATLGNLALAQCIKQSLPDFMLTASVLLDVSEPAQALLLREVFATLVPSGRCLRDLSRLRQLRDVFPGRLRLLVNEACLPGCPHRTQHFYEMTMLPRQSQSLCAKTLRQMPWTALLGSWILPLHVHLYAGIADEFKLAGRVTLGEPPRYLAVLGAYLWGLPMTPDRIGGGPASAVLPMPISDSVYRTTLACDKQCGACDTCREYYAHYALSH